jgi:GTP-binding protein
MTSLKYYAHHKHFQADPGQSGSSNNKTGANGADVTLSVPIGTEIWSEDENVLICDLTVPLERLCIAEGGRGGFGNVHYKTSLNRAPRRSDPGQPGETFGIVLKLKIMAHIGIIGLPNSGKSSLLSSISRAKAKIGAYEFTTLEPQLGVIVGCDTRLIVADLPGIIKGASEGKGLGHRFLSHTERCEMLLICIDSTSDAPQETYDLLLQELERYDALMNTHLCHKSRWVIFTKNDLIQNDMNKSLKIQDIHFSSSQPEIPCFSISSLTEDGIASLIQALKNNFGKV